MQSAPLLVTEESKTRKTYREKGESNIVLSSHGIHKMQDNEECTPDKYFSLDTSDHLFNLSIMPRYMSM